MSQMKHKKVRVVFVNQKKKKWKQMNRKKSNIQFHKNIIPEHVVKMNEI